MRLALLAALISLALLVACSGLGTSGTGGTNDTCPSADDAGAYDPELFTLDDAGDLTVDLDAGNGGLDLGMHTGGAGIVHTYEWPCIITYDCQTPRDASITFTSPNGVNQWTAQSMAFDNGAMCVTATSTPDAGGSGASCCVTCYAAQMEAPCNGGCISSFDSCSTGTPGCACKG